MRLRITVVAALEAGSHLANAVNTVKMAEGFARLGHDVEIICRASAEGAKDPQCLAPLYGLSAPLRWRQVPVHVGKHEPLARRVLWRSLLRRPHLVYARNYVAPAYTAHLGIPTVAESHAHIGHMSPAFERMLRASTQRAFRGLVTISPVLSEHYAERGVPIEKLLVLPDAVDPLLFVPPNQLPPSPFEGQGPHVVYAGHLYDYKGIPTVLSAAAMTPHIRYHFLGGLPEDRERNLNRARQAKLTNVQFHDPVPHSQVPPYLWHADLLVLPPSADHPSAAWTSPVKLGEYLASTRPVIASDIPALRYWLTDQEAAFFRADDPESLAQTVRALLADGKRRASLSDHGARKCCRWGYDQRARKVLVHCGLAENTT